MVNEKAAHAPAVEPEPVEEVEKTAPALIPVLLPPKPKPISKPIEEEEKENSQ